MSRFMVCLALAWMTPATALAASHHFVCVCECGFDEQSFEVSQDTDCAEFDGTPCADADGDERELELCRKSTEPWAMACVPGDADGDGLVQPADAQFAIAAARGLRPVLVMPAETFAVVGAPLTIAGQNLLADRADHYTVAVRDGDAVPPRLQRRVEVDGFEVADGALRFDFPALPGDGPAERVVEVSHRVEGVSLRSNGLRLVAVDRPPVALDQRVCGAAPRALEFDAQRLDLPLGAARVGALLDGRLALVAGDAVGEVRVELPGRVSLTARFDHDGVVVRTPGAECRDGSDCRAGPCEAGRCLEETLRFVPDGPPSQVWVDGEPRVAPEVAAALSIDLLELGPERLDRWQPVNQASVALMAIASTPQWAGLTAAGMPGGVVGFIDINWCKTAAYAAATAIAAAATAGCAALTAGCAAGTTITFGGMAIPCSGLIGLCAGGVFAGTAAAYELTLSLWDP